jgi:hypothetical protein
MAEEADEFGPLKSRTTTPGKTPEQHAIDREIRAAAKVQGTGMLPRSTLPSRTTLPTKPTARALA